MENKIITMTNKKFGAVRKIAESGKMIYCGADVAKALGYTNPRKALTDHCRCVTKRYAPHPQSKDKQMEMSFIPEADVYRLICHSKLPSAIEFEKWVFEDVVPKAINEELPVKSEQLTIETSEYHYFDKTYKGQPVLSVRDIEHFTGLSTSMINWYLRNRSFEIGKDYYKLEKFTLCEFKAENPNVQRILGGPYNIVTKSGFIKLMKTCNCKSETPKCFEKLAVPLLKEKKGGSWSVYTPNEEMNALMAEVRDKAQRIQAYSYLLTNVDLEAKSRMFRGELRCEIQRLNMMIDKIDDARF